MLSEMAAVTGRTAASDELAALRAEIVDAFREAYVGDDGEIEGDTQGAYAFALAYDLLPAELRAQAVDRLVAGIEEFDGHLSTGFLSTIEALKLLSANGHNDLAYRLVTSESFPSWGFMLAHGATTIWERWDGYVPGREPDEFQDPGMNSFNHYSIGAVGEWIVRTIGGLRLDESSTESSGFTRFVIEPQPGPGVDWAALTFQSEKGPIKINWRTRDNGEVSIQATVPDAASATLIRPDGSRKTIRGGGSVEE
jgi:alpha-L-rhamnosidase